jgi:hypothetical protein
MEVSKCDHKIVSIKNLTRILLNNSFSVELINQLSQWGEFGFCQCKKKKFTPIIKYSSLLVICLTLSMCACWCGI